MGQFVISTHLNKMNFCAIFLFSAVFANVCNAADIVVDVDLEEMNQEELNGALSDRTIVCQIFGQGRCATACAGQLCTSTCQARCGLFRTASYTCSAIAAGTCSSGYQQQQQQATQLHL